MKSDFDDTNKREKILNFYPCDHNFYIQLYTDPDDCRGRFQTERDIQRLLDDCAVYFLSRERLVDSTSSLSVDPCATTLCNVLSGLKSGLHETGT